MAEYRSKSYSDGKMQIEPYYGPPSTTRSYSTSYASSSNTSALPPPHPVVAPPQKLKKGMSTKSWSFNDPEFQRKRRVASYKVYSVEGKLKGSVRKSVRWLKNRYTHMVYGWW